MRFRVLSNTKNCHGNFCPDAFKSWIVWPSRWVISSCHLGDASSARPSAGSGLTSFLLVKTAPQQFLSEQGKQLTRNNNMSSYCLS